MRLMWFSMRERGIWPMLRLVLLGSHLRSIPLVCSLVGRCQGERGSQKYTGALIPAWIFCQSAISRPWSQVRDCTRWGGARSRASVTARVTVAAVLSATAARRVYRLDRSTRVMTAERLWAPFMRSPSQCPGRRSVSPPGRSLTPRMSPSWLRLACSQRLRDRRRGRRREPVYMFV